MDRLSPEAISSVVGSIYEAAYDPDGWRTAIDRMHGLLDCSRACIAHTGVSHWSSIATIDDAEYSSKECHAVHMRDSYTAASVSQRIGTIFRRYEVIDEVQFQRRELWNEWMRPRDMSRSLTSNLCGDSTGVWSIHLHRSEGQPEFDEEEARALQILAGHMRHTKSIGDRIHHSRHLSKLFEQLTVGLVVVDNACKLAFINGEAEAMLSRSTAISIEAGRLFSRDQATNAKLAALVASATSTDLSGTRGGTILVQAEPDDGLASIVVSAAPFGGYEMYGLPSEPLAIVMLRDVFLQPSPHLSSHLQTVFGLTASEASLCSVLASGVTLQEAAMRSGITIKTARTYLERIFSKTAMRQQSQLVALLKDARPLI